MVRVYGVILALKKSCSKTRSRSHKWDLCNMVVEIRQQMQHISISEIRPVSFVDHMTGSTRHNKHNLKRPKCQQQYLFTAEILPAPALASPPARTKEDSVAFMDVDAAVLLVAEDVVFVVRFIMLLLSSPITIVEPVLLRALDAEPFCC